MSEKEKHPGGRPSKYKPEYNEEAYKLSLLGATDAEIADFFEVTEQTLNNWKNDFPKFFESIKGGKIKADAQVAKKLYERATGAEWVQEQAFKVKESHYDDNGKKVEREKVVTVPVRFSAPPDTQAATLWLKNRKSERWKDKSDVIPLPNQTVNLVVISNKPESLEHGHTITLTPQAVTGLPQSSD